MVILDMEMPKSCVECDIGEGCTAFSVIFKNSKVDNIRPDNCPIKAEIPKNATNGDVLKIMFPNLTVKAIDIDEYTNKPKTIEISVEKGMHILTTISAEVWNAPWKGQKEK